eukprot:TRINITY_DN29224_c0_g1_i1.p1 TRINITY_DN29224_c0_g1~~TRINITY_DN29224_c0_g1_i1.p1  ORF type:complete len:245 (-),score=27.56 TRINITY_DN29224_c0_g1_i1:79-768(-)
MCFSLLAVQHAATISIELALQYEQQFLRIYGECCAMVCCLPFLVFSCIPPLCGPRHCVAAYVSLSVVTASAAMLVADASKNYTVRGVVLFNLISEFTWVVVVVHAANTTVDYTRVVFYPITVSAAIFFTFSIIVISHCIGWALPAADISLLLMLICFIGAIFAQAVFGELGHARCAMKFSLDEYCVATSALYLVFLDISLLLQRFAESRQDELFELLRRFGCVRLHAVE